MTKRGSRCRTTRSESRIVANLAPARPRHARDSKDARTRLFLSSCIFDEIGARRDAITYLSTYISLDQQTKMVVNMEMQGAKDAVLELMKDKEKIESNLLALKGILDSNNVGMDEPLTDSEGYPRQDIDVYQVRHTRHKILCLRNDHKALMKKIEEGLHKVHALAGKNETQELAIDIFDSQETETMEPFLRVNLVSPDSPAEIAGIQVEDLILEFGSINYQNFKSLMDIVKLVENSRYKVINVKIKRGSNVIVLPLTPRPWVGKGLLGCNVILVEIVER